jgi:tetratricopeptide (TPR) repeat protein
MVGTIRYSQGDFSGAIPCLEEAVARGRRSAGTWTNLGICYTHQGRYGEALSQFTKAAISEPMNPDYQLNLALGLLNAGQPDAAHDLMEQIARRWPRYEPGRRALRSHFEPQS